MLDKHHNFLIFKIACKCWNSFWNMKLEKRIVNITINVCNIKWTYVTKWIKCYTNVTVRSTLNFIFPWEQRYLYILYK